MTLINIVNNDPLSEYNIEGLKFFNNDYINNRGGNMASYYGNIAL